MEENFTQGHEGPMLPEEHSATEPDTKFELDQAKKLIHEMKEKLDEENQKLRDMKNQIFREKDFKVSKFAAFDGPNYYSDRKAFVFNVFIAPTGDSVDFYRNEITKVLPEFSENKKKICY